MPAPRLPWRLEELSSTIFVVGGGALVISCVCVSFFSYLFIYLWGIFFFSLLKKENCDYYILRFLSGERG